MIFNELRRVLILPLCALFLPLFAWGTAQRTDDGKEDTSLWLFTQDFIKFGKKEVYLSQKEALLTSMWANFKDSEKDTFYAIEDLTEPDYIYLMPLNNFAALEGWFKKEQVGRTKMADKATLLDTTLNFSVRSLNRYLSTCSLDTPPLEEALQSLPYVQYFIYSITPGNEEIFETHLQNMKQQMGSSSPSYCWYVWKVLIGADVPKYIVCIMDKTEKGLEQQVKSLNFFSGTLKEILKNQKEGKGKSFKRTTK